MPKRLIDGEALWMSDKLGQVEPEAFRAEYANLLPLALANGSFECNPRAIWALVYAMNRPSITPDTVVAILDEFERVGLLLRFEADGKIWGWWAGIDKPGRLPTGSGYANAKKGAEPPDNARSTSGQHPDSARSTSGQHPNNSKRGLGLGEVEVVGIGLGMGGGVGVGVGEGEGTAQEKPQTTPSPLFDQQKQPENQKPEPENQKPKTKKVKVGKDGTPYPLDFNSWPLDDRLTWSDQHNKVRVGPSVPKTETKTYCPKCSGELGALDGCECEL